MEGSSRNLVTLNIEGALLECDRADLISHSDYFRAMFEGNFIERNQNVILLNGIELEAMKIILRLLWDREYPVDEHSLLLVLQAACMLQFLQVKSLCVERIQQSLTVGNCLKIWLYTEQLDIKVIYRRAKLIALLEFMFVKDTDYFLELNLEDVINYLGNINLRCPNEFAVFEALIVWYQHSDQQNADTLLKLLYCIDFTKASRDQIHQMISRPSVIRDDAVANVLKCIFHIKNDRDLLEFNKESVERANALLASKSRNVNGFPCILVNTVHDEGTAEKSMSGHYKILFYDQFKRKRRYTVLEHNPSTDFSVGCVDTSGAIFKKLFDIESTKCSSLDGFKIIGFKHFTFLFGGEYTLGNGDWNTDFYIYDILKETWNPKLILPFRRRHFESCICGKYLFIVGGTGPFRVIQENLFWLEIEDRTWSKEVKFPFKERQIKCCSFKDELIILNFNNKRGYVFDPVGTSWTELMICDTNDTLPIYSKNLAVFSYRDSLYIKKKKLFELKVQDNMLVIVNEFELPETIYTKNVQEVQSVLFNNVLYSLKKQWFEESNRQVISLELFNVETHQVTVTYDRTNDEVLEIGNEKFKFKPYLSIFNTFHQHLIDDNILVNVFR